MNLTVILASYERADLLHLALLCLKHQSRLPDEVIITDDGSETDILGSLSEADADLGFSRVKFIRQENRGFRPARSRNNAIRESSGDYLVFWDQDLIATRCYLEAFSRFGRSGQFLVGFPVYLSEQQTGLIASNEIAGGDYLGLLTASQLGSVRRQFAKDTFYQYLGRVFPWKRYRPKVRGGCFGITREDILMVDGFDENYQGWGAEDDDLGRRLYRAGVVGRTAFRKEFPIHLWHPHEVTKKESPNLEYYKRRLNEIARGDCRAVNGISNPLGEDVPVVEVLK